MTRKTKTTPETVAAKTKAFAAAFAPHPRQQEFMDAAIAMRAQDLPTDVSPDLKPTQTLTTARANFETALQAVIFLPSEERFYVIFADHPASPSLTMQVRAAWEASTSGEYGTHPPLTYIAKN